MDGIVPCVFPIFLTQPPPIPLPNSATDSCQPINGGVVMHSNMWLAESYQASAVWLHDWDIKDRIMAFLSIFQWRLAMFTETNWTPKRNVNVMEFC